MNERSDSHQLRANQPRPNSAIALSRPILRRSASEMSVESNQERAWRMILKRIIDGERQAIGAERENGVDQRSRAKIAAGRHIKILPKIFAHGAA